MTTATRRHFGLGVAATLAATRARAATQLTIGVVLPLSGAFANEGTQYENGIRLYQAMHGVTAAGLPVRLVVRDDQGPGSGDLSRRLTQELILREKADIMLGYCFTPNAMATASLLTEAKKPGVIINAATSVITERSPYFVRVSFTTVQMSYVLGEYAAQQGVKTAYTIVSDYGPGIDAETWFTKAFTKFGGKVIGAARTAVSEMEYAPHLQRAMEAKPESIFSFAPGGDVAVAFMKEAKRRGVTEAGIKLLVTGDVVEDNSLPLFGDAVKGVISVANYQVGLDNPKNRAFIAKYKELYGKDAIPNMRAVAGYDGMALIHQAVEATKGDLAAAALMKAMIGATVDSPRGRFTIDPETRDIDQTMYVREGRLVEGHWQNAQIAAYPNVKDPAKDPALK